MRRCLKFGKDKYSHNILSHFVTIRVIGSGSIDLNWAEKTNVWLESEYEVTRTENG